MGDWDLERVGGVGCEMGEEGEEGRVVGTEVEEGDGDRMRFGVVVGGENASAVDDHGGLVAFCYHKWLLLFLLLQLWLRLWLFRILRRRGGGRCAV